MELRVFDKTVQPLGAIDELASLLWHTKYFDVGTFSLLAPITDNNSRLLVEGNLITKHDGKKEVKTADGGVWRRAAQITYVHITKDENGLEQLEAQGYMLSWWLNKRCIYPQIVATGTNQYLINLMVKNNCGSAAGTKRRFPLLTFLAQETIDGVAVEYANEVYAQLGQEVKARAQAGKLGYDILLNERERLFGFYLYKGNDLTATNTEGNTPCIFSRDFDNVNEQEYTASIENCGNFIYVQGAADDDGSQPVTTVDGEGATGLDLVEVFCDATDIARKYQQGETEVNNVLEPIFDKRFISQSYACRKGKGMHAASDTLKEWLYEWNRYHPDQPLYAIKADIHHYFQSIDHAVLKTEIRKVIKDAGVLALLDRIIDHNGNMPDGVGIPVGNLTSQLFANIYLDALDQFIKHELGVEAYIRYMDDFVILSPDKEQLRSWLARIEQFLREELRLEFNPKTTILAAKNGIDFVGYKHRATHRKVRKDSIKRIKRTIKKCESGKITKEQLQKSIQSWTGHAGHADSYNLRKKIETLAEAAIEKAA